MIVSVLIIWTFCWFYLTVHIFADCSEGNPNMIFMSPPMFPRSHSDLRESAASGPAGAAPRGPAEAAGAATEAAG